MSIQIRLIIASNRTIHFDRSLSRSNTIESNLDVTDTIENRQLFHRSFDKFSRSFQVLGVFFVSSHFK